MRRSNNGAASASTMFERLPSRLYQRCAPQNASILKEHFPLLRPGDPRPGEPAWWNNHSKRHSPPSARSA